MNQNKIYDSSKLLKLQNDILKMVSKVNRFSIKMSNVEEFFSKSIEMMAEQINIKRIWGVLIDSNLEYKFYHDTDSAGVDLSLQNHLKKNDYPDCIKNALNNQKRYYINKHNCNSCNFFNEEIFSNGFSITIKYQEKIYGVIVFYLHENVIFDDETLDIITELASDFGYGIHNIFLRNTNEIIQEKLRKSEETFRDIFETTPVGIFQTTIEGQTINLNREMAKILNIERSKAVGYYTDIEKQLYYDPLKRIEFIKLLKKDGNVRNFKYKARRYTGEEIWLVMNAKLNSDKKVITGFTWDITKSVNLEEDIRKSEENLRTTLNSIGDGVIVTDIDGKIININKVAQNLTGFSYEEAFNQSLESVFRIINSKSRKISKNPVSRVLETGKIVGLANHTVLISRNGKEYQVADSAAPIKKKNGEILGVVLVFRDVTKDYYLQEQLKINRQRLQFIIEGGNIGTFVWYVNSGKAIFNNRWAEMLGYSLAELEPSTFETWEKLTHKEDLKIAKENIEKLFNREKEYYSVEMRMKHKAGHWVWILAVGKVAEWGVNGKPLMMSGIHTDISGMKESELKYQQSEEKYRRLFTRMLNAFALHEIVLDEKGIPVDYRFLEVNKAFEKMTGLRYKEIKGKLVTEVIPGIENDPADWIGKYGKVATTGEEIKFENHIHGTDQWFKVYAYSPEKNKFATIFENISEKKITDNIIAKSEKNFRDVVENNAIPMVLTDKNQDIILFNKKFSQTFGYTIDDIQTAEKWWQTAYPNEKYREKVKEQWNEAVKKAQGKNCEIEPQKWKMTCKNGTEKMVEFSFRSLGEIDAISMKDMTDIIKKQEELKALHEIYQKTIENAQSVPYKLNYLTRTYDYISDKCEELLGIRKENLTFEKMQQIVKNPKVADTISTKDYHEYRRHFKAGNIDTYNVEFQIDTSKGKKWITDRSLPIKENGKVVGAMGILQDITELKLSEMALRKSDERFKLAVEGSKDGLWDWNLKNDNLYHSEQFARMLGFEYHDLPFTIETWYRLVHPKDIELVKKRVDEYLGGKVKDYVSTFRMRCKDGSYKWVTSRGKALFDRSGKAYRFVGFNTDITEQRKNERVKELLEKQIRKSQKMETLGTLAGGIAHDFNNILTPIMGYSDMAKSKLKPEDDFYEVFDEIFQASLRARELIYQMLNFSRQSEHKKAPMDIVLVLKEVLKLLRPSIPATIKINEKIGLKSKKILGDPTKIHQVIMNLCTNAYQAMEKKGGEMFIGLETVKIDEESSKQYLDLNEGEYHKLIISDTGEGMDDATKERIFEPFFTTKEVNKGTGLGLAVVHGIVQSHNGAITVYSEKKKGSTFNLFFPVIEDNATVNTVNDSTLKVGDESILVIDDKISITKILNKMLSGLGYNTTVINSSIEGLNIFKQNQEQFQLIISDLTMPEMTGLELAEKIHEIRADIPVIMVTGYGNQVKKDDMEKAGISKIIGKPILLHDISNAVREILDK